MIFGCTQSYYRGDLEMINSSQRFKCVEDVWRICPELKLIMEGGPVVGRSGSIHTPQGTSTPNNVVVLSNLVSDLQPINTLEIGMAYGASTLAVLAAMRDTKISTRSNVSQDLEFENTRQITQAGTHYPEKKLHEYLPNVKHYAIDPFQQLHFDDCGVMSVERAGFLEAVKVHYAPSYQILPKLLESDLRFDLIYIDGSHLFEDTFVDACFASRLLKVGGIMLFDDSTDPHVAKVIKFITLNFSSALEPVNLTPWRPKAAQNWHYKLGKLFGKVQLTGFRRDGDFVRQYGARLVDF